MIIGDRFTGKTTLALDAVLAQSMRGEVDLNVVKSVYVAIGQRARDVVRFFITVFERGCLDTIFVLASASSPAAVQYVAPFSGCTLAE